MRNLLSVLFILQTFTVNATNFYVSNDGSNSNSGTLKTMSWQTLSKVQEAANANLIKAGDSILFKKGDVFTGTLKWTILYGQHCPTGTSALPITFSGYGEGKNPVFLYPEGGSLASENRILMLFSGVDHIIVDGFDFTDTDTTNNKITAANCGVPIYLGTIGETTTNHCIIRNVNISLCGMGIVIVGDHNTITHSRLTNFKNLKSTPNIGGSTGYEDYGANAITITGNENEISYNYISGAWAESLDFGWNGGACEMYNSCSRNRFIHNAIYDCGGVAEFGAQEKNASSVDNLFAFNTIINCGTLTYCNTKGEFAIQVSNVQYFNNAIIEDNNSRFSGINTGRGIITEGPKGLITADKELFAFNGDPEAATMFNLKNNIFQLSTGINIARKSGHEKYQHEDNMYILQSGSVVNYKLNNSECLRETPIFRQDSSKGELLWKYQLVSLKGEVKSNLLKDKSIKSKEIATIIIASAATNRPYQTTLFFSLLIILPAALAFSNNLKDSKTP